MPTNSVCFGISKTSSIDVNLKKIEKKSSGGGGKCGNQGCLMRLKRRGTAPHYRTFDQLKLLVILIEINRC